MSDIDSVAFYTYVNERLAALVAALRVAEELEPDVSYQESRLIRLRARHDELQRVADVIGLYAR